MPGVFSIPALNDKAESLDSLLLNLDRIWKKSEEPLELGEIIELKAESIALDRCFSQWLDSRITDFKPTIVGYTNLSQHNHGSEPVVGYWQGKIDTYFDLYVAGVWNISRAARLLLVTLVMKLSDRLESDDSCIDYIHAANYAVEDIFASVPYHLVDDLPAFVSELATGKEITDVGRALGGLLLLHPLYIVSKTKFLSQKTRDYSQRCLAWIGSNMGIGQATVLAEAGEAEVNTGSSNQSQNH